MISKETNFWKHDMRARLYSVGIREGRGGGDSSTLALKIIRCLDSNKNVKNMLKYM